MKSNGQTSARYLFNSRNDGMLFGSLKTEKGIVNIKTDSSFISKNWKSDKNTLYKLVNELTAKSDSVISKVTKKDFKTFQHTVDGKQIIFSACHDRYHTDLFVVSMNFVEVYA
jgi:hypothetical protein